MASQKLRLEAEMRDNASPAIRKLRQELSDLQAQTAESRGISKLNKEIAQLRKESGDVGATAGMKAFTGWMSEAGGKATSFLAPIRAMPGILGAVGIGSIAAGASVAGLAAEMKKLGEKALDLKELSRETGMSAEFVNSWSKAGAHFGVAENAMNSMLDSFASKLPDFNRSIGGMFQEFSIWPDVVRKMKSESPAEALMDALRQVEQVGREKGPQVQRQVLEAMGLGPEAEKLFAEHGLAGLREQLSKSWALPSSGLAAGARDLRDATSQFENAVVKLENTIGPDFLKAMTAGIHGLEVAVEGLEASFKWMRDFFGKDAKDWNKDHSPGGRFGTAPSNRSAAPEGGQSLMPRYRQGPETYQYRRNDGHSLWHKSSYDGSGFGGLLQNASFVTSGTGSGTMTGAVSEGARAGVLQAFREAALEQQLGQSSSGDGSGAGEVSVSGFSGGRRGFMARGGHFGGRRGFGRNTEDGGADYGTPSKSLLDFIAKSEGAKSYNTSLGNGRFLPGHHEANLEGMSLNQVLDLGRYMRQQPGNPNSSALGRYQITGETIRDLMGRMHLSGDEKFDAKMQDAMASKLIQDEGPRALQRWASLRGGRMSTALDLLKSGNIASVPGTSNVGPLSNLRVLNEQCVSLAKAAVGATGSVTQWRRGIGALAGTLKAGTPVATFLNRQGQASDRYAGGGSGTPGAHLDHAGIFQSYIRDRSGKIVGMNIAEQYQGSHGVHSKAYYNGGFGESNASNYSAVLGPDGQPLGGSRNPMSRRATNLAGAGRPNAGRRATGLADGARGASEGSDHRLTIDLRDPGNAVKATRIERNGLLKVDMPNKWQTHRNPLIGA